MRLFYGAPKQTGIGGFRVQTSVYGSPIPIVYGTARIAGNLIHMPKLPIPGGQSKQQSKGASGGTQYTAPIAIGLCEGPIAGIFFTWRDKDGHLTFAGNYDVNGWSLFLGTIAPAAWSYLTTNFLAQAVPYQLTAYVANPNAPLPNDSLSSYSWEIQGFKRFAPGANNSGVIDASPADIIPDLLESTQYGLGWSSARIGPLGTFADYCAAFSLFASPAIDTQVATTDILNELLEVSNTGAVWSDGVLKFVPYGDTPGTGNGHTYTPNTTPLYDLTDVDFLPRGADLDPITITRKDPSTAFNQVVVEYQDRDLDYNTTTYPATDQFAASTYGLVAMPTLTLHSIKSAAVAQQVAQVRLQREQNVRNTYQFRLGWKYSLLEPMDLVTLTEAQTGLSVTPVRLTVVEELADEAGIECTAEDWPFGTASATRYGTATGSGTMPNANVAPGDTSTPIIVEGPSALASAPLELWLGATGGANWGGCEVWISTDNITFSQIGIVNGKAAYGTLTGTLASFGSAYPVQDGSSTLSVDVTASGRTLTAFSATDFANLQSLCFVEGASTASPEWIAYKNAALTSAGHYNLTTLYRGLYGSTINSHASGKHFLLADGAVARLPWPQGKAGQTVFFKLPAFNIYGAALQDISTVSSFAYVIGGDPIPVATQNPQGTVAVDANGQTSWTADFPGDVQSIRWSFSTSGYPADATVAASGTLINLGGAHTATQTHFTTLTFGQTAFVTIVGFSAPGGNGVQLRVVHIQGAYLNNVASKFDTYVGSGFTLTSATITSARPNPTKGTFEADSGSNPIKAQGTLSLKISNGVTVTSVSIYGKLTYVTPATERLTVSVDQISHTTGAVTTIAHPETDSSSSAVQLVTSSGLSTVIDSQNNAYQASVLLADSGATATALELWNVVIGYTQNNSNQTT
jgi:hypothetical protein